MAEQPESTAPFERPLGKAEWFYWRYDRVSCTNFVVVAEFDELPPKTPLIKALDTARKRHPLLGAKIVSDGSGAARYEPGPAGSVAIPILQGGEPAWRAEVVKQLDERFPDGAYPLIRCMAFPAMTETTRSAIVFTFHHGVTDAASATRLVEEVLTDALLGLPVDDSAFPARPPQEALYPTHYSGLGATLRRLWYAFQDWLARRSKGKPLALPAPAGGDTRALHIEPLLMPRDRMMALRKQCRTQKTTVHGALGAAQLLALAEELHGGEAGMDRLGSAIGMRERLDPPVTDREIGMYISMVLTEHGVGPDATPWDLARDIKAQLEQRVTRGDGHLLWSSFPPASQFGDDDAGSQKLARLMQVVPIPSIVTNIGRVGPEAGEGPIKALHFTMAPQPGCALVNAVCSYRGRLVANCTFDTRLVPAEGAARVVARMGEIIEQMAG